VSGALALTLTSGVNPEVATNLPQGEIRAA